MQPRLSAGYSRLRDMRSVAALGGCACAQAYRLQRFSALDVFGQRATKPARQTGVDSRDLGGLAGRLGGAQIEIGTGELWVLAHPANIRASAVSSHADRF